jgi:N-acetyl-gamma-glutamyl-phosphate reductase
MACVNGYKYKAMRFGYKMHKIFIDGHVGTTGLLIHQRLQARDDIELLQIPHEHRKDPELKREALGNADLVILCLPDEAARESVAMADQTTRFIDASTAHRVNPNWTYGLPEMAADHRQRIAGARYVSNPGCWATGFLLPIIPLLQNEIISPAANLNVNGVSGFSGGGREMIERYHARSADHPDDLWYSRPYSLALHHKHLPEMAHYSGLNNKPLFQPSVGHYEQGMLVSTGLFADQLSSAASLQGLYDCIGSWYENEDCVRVHEPNDDSTLDSGFLDPQGNNGTNRQDIYIFGNDNQVLLISTLDNLGKGASGAAVQNMNIMLGQDELNGLTV